jgi:pimeloyl-ACP methyl ester carboxylesterase
VQAPTLLIWGEADAETPLWMGKTMEKEIADAGLVVLEGGSHFAFLEQWQRFTLIVKQFLQGG